MILLVCILFVVGLLLDVAWAKYTLAVSGRNPLAAAVWAITIYMPMGVYTPSLAHHPWLVVPMALGAGIGTLVTVWRAQTLVRRATLVGSPSEGAPRGDSA